MARGNFPFNFGDDFYPSRSGFEDPNQRPMKPYCRPYSLTPSQVQYGGVRRVRRCLAALAPLQSPGSSQQTSSSVGSSDPHNKNVMLFEAEVCCAMKKIFRSKTAKTIDPSSVSSKLSMIRAFALNGVSGFLRDRRHAIRFTFHHENTNVIPKRMCL